MENIINGYKKIKAKIDSSRFTHKSTKIGSNICDSSSSKMTIDTKNIGMIETHFFSSNSSGVSIHCHKKLSGWDLTSNTSVLKIEPSDICMSGIFYNTTTMYSYKETKENANILYAKMSALAKTMNNAL